MFTTIYALRVLPAAFVSAASTGFLRRWGGVVSVTWFWSRPAENNDQLASISSCDWIGKTNSLVVSKLGQTTVNWPRATSRVSTATAAAFVPATTISASTASPALGSIRASMPVPAAAALPSRRPSQRGRQRCSQTRQWIAVV